MAKPLHILLVDDDEGVRTMVRRRLARVGRFVFFEAADGPEAFALIACERIDLVLLDLVLPGMDGLEVARRIRVLPSPAGQVPILVFSARTAAQYEPLARAVGCNAYIQKPLVEMAQLSETVAQLLAPH